MKKKLVQNLHSCSYEYQSPMKIKTQITSMHDKITNRKNRKSVEHGIQKNDDLRCSTSSGNYGKVNKI